MLPSHLSQHCASFSCPLQPFCQSVSHGAPLVYSVVGNKKQLYSMKTSGESYGRGIFKRSDTRVDFSLFPPKSPETKIRLLYGPESPILVPCALYSVYILGTIGTVFEDSMESDNGTVLIRYRCLQPACTRHKWPFSSKNKTLEYVLLRLCLDE